jgi:hypothetical protein
MILLAFGAGCTFSAPFSVSFSVAFFAVFSVVFFVVFSAGFSAFACGQPLAANSFKPEWKKMESSKRSLEEIMVRGSKK